VSVNKVELLKKRYFAKFGANLIGFELTLVTQSIIPRGLGPKNYGDFQYLTQFFQRVIGFFDMGTSIGFYSKLSHRSKEYSLVSFYLYFSGVISIFLLIFVLFSQLIGIEKNFWPNLDIGFVYLAAVWGILTWFSQVMQKITDAYGITVSGEKVRVLQRIIAFVIILGLYFLNQISLNMRRVGEAA